MDDPETFAEELAECWPGLETFVYDENSLDTPIVDGSLESPPFRLNITGVPEPNGPGWCLIAGLYLEPDDGDVMRIAGTDRIGPAATVEELSAETKRALKREAVDRTRSLMAGLDFLADRLSTDGAPVDMDDTFFGAIRHVADRLAETYGADPSNDDEREWASILIGALRGERVDLSRSGMGMVAVSGTGEAFDPWWTDGKEG